jgi:zinc D-Ala-D-Ala carboxypeptidase
MNFFQYSEFDCRCGKCGLKGDVMDHTFLTRLDELRFMYGKAMVVTSGVRCIERNRDEGGKEGSYHLVKNGACAADIAIVGGEDRRQLVALALALGFSVGVDKDFVHLDDRYRKFKRPAVLFTY